MTSRLQNRRDIASAWTSANPTLAAGEMGLETDTSKFKLGDGVTAWNSLAYAYTAGAAGAQGLTGTQGVQGIQGITGTQGLTGIQGADGLNGAQGLTGTQGVQGLLGLQGLEGTTYTAPTLGSTTLTSGSTVTTIAGMAKISSESFVEPDTNGFEQDLAIMNIMGGWN
jgi:hypothetical protein